MSEPARAYPSDRSQPDGARIFISYRRADSGGWARSLNDRLDERLGKGRVFRDVAMQSGVDFHQHVESLLDRCDVLLAVIGKSWVSMTDAGGNRRLHDPGDLVRSEVARALQRPDVHVIPVLVDGAQMPTEPELPPDLAALSRRHACELSDSRWDYDVEGLATRLRELLGERPPRRPWTALPARLVAAVAALVGVVLALVMVLPALRTEDVSPVKAATLGKPILDRDVSFGQYLDRAGFSRAPYTAAQLERRGVLVMFDFRIEGYRDKKLPVRWQLINVRTNDRVDGNSDVRITPNAQIDKGSWPVWVPVPRQRGGRFFVELQLLDDRGSVPIGHLRTKQFDAPRAAGAS